MPRQLFCASFQRKNIPVWITVVSHSASVIFPSLFLHLKWASSSLNIFCCLCANGKHSFYNNYVFHRSGTEMQLMLLRWCFLWTRLGALYSWNCSASSADSQCHNKCCLITSSEYGKSGRTIHSEERRGRARKALRNTKEVIDLGSR